MKLKTVTILLTIFFLFTCVTISDAKHYSTSNPHQHVIHHIEHHDYSHDNGNPPPHRHGEVTDDERRGIGQYYNSIRGDD